MSWDTIMPSELRKQTVDSVNYLEKYEIRAGLGKKRQTVLHVFSDGSENVYATAVYAVFVRDGVRFASLCYAKTKVVLLKSKTIP